MNEQAKGLSLYGDVVGVCTDSSIIVFQPLDIADELNAILMDTSNERTNKVPIWALVWRPING